MDKQIDYIMLLERIADNYKASDSFVNFKNINEYSVDGKYVGDLYTIGMFAPLPDGDMRLIVSVSPFSDNSKKSSDQMLVYKGSELVDSVAWSDYVPKRTGVMDSLVIKKLGLTTEPTDKILFVGSGRIGSVSGEAMMALRENFGGELDVSYIRKSDVPSEMFEASYPGAKHVKLAEVSFSDYAYIFCHTNSKEDVITKANFSDLSKLKLITYYIDSSIGYEIEPAWLEDFIMTHGESHFLIDTPETLLLKKEFKLIKHDPLKIKSLKDILNEVPEVQTPYVFRSGGTALQNLALYDYLKSND